MRRKTLGVSAFVTSLMLFGAVPSSHAAIIDFTNYGVWGAAANQTSLARTIEGVLVTVSSQNGLLTFNNGGDVNPLCGLTGLSCQGDGLGVGDDEVTRGASLLDNSLERLNVSFSAPVTISKLGFLDLFAANILTGDTATETAMWKVTLQGGATTSGSLNGNDSSTTLGWRQTTTSYSNVIGLQFFAVPPASTNSDFSVAKIEFTKVGVPEPATLLLSGLGMAFVSLRRRVRRAA
jgi:hypothetical protein